MYIPVLEGLSKSKTTMQDTLSKKAKKHITCENGSHQS